MRGKLFKVNLSLVLCFVFVFSAFLLFPGSAVWSSQGNFTVTTNVSLNWTTGSMNITSNSTNLIVTVSNKSNAITPRYFVAAKYPNGSYSGYNSAKELLCFTGGMAFLVQNSSSGVYTNMSDPLNDTNSTVFTLHAYQDCPPGFYEGKFNVYKNGTSEYANVSADVIIPVSSSNTFYEPNSTAFVRGSMAVNSNIVHKYYFNTSVAENSTGLTVNLSWGDYKKDLGMYLFDSSGNLLTKADENYTKEEIYYSLPSAPDIWELWIYGNVTVQQEYTANMYFTTLNVTNMSNTVQGISSIDFGTLDPITNKSSEINITLENKDTRSWTGVKERSEIYRVDTWNLKNQTGDYYFIVPPFAQKVKAMIEWKGGTRWYVSLNDSNDAFRGNSTERYKTGNKTGMNQIESVLYSTINVNNDGLWSLAVGNLSAISDDKYNVTVYVWLPSSNWVNSDYPSSFDFDSSAGTNHSKNVSLYINLPRMNITSGSYQGFVEYYKPSEWTRRIPLSFTVNSGTLLVNDSLNTITTTKKDNRYFNRLGAGVIQLSIPVNNTGTEDIYFVNTTSDNALTKSSYYMNFTVGWPSNPIQAGTSDTIYVNISINKTHTSDSAGIYTGWIKLNTTNSSNATRSSYPFDIFDVNLRVNLTNLIKLSINKVDPSFVPQTENASNMTMNMTVYLANGTLISKNTILKYTDFYGFDLINVNTSYSTSTSLTGLIPPGAPTWSVVCPSGSYNHCRLNGTLPSGIPGGKYNVRGSVRLNTSIMGGTGLNISSGIERSSVEVEINDVGIKFTNRPTDFIELDAGSTVYHIVDIFNYGPVAISSNKGRMTLSKPSASLVTITFKNSTCTQVSAPGISRNFSIGAYANCSMTWQIVASSEADDDSDYIMQIGLTSGHANFNGNNNITASVDVDVVTTTPGGDTPSTTPDTTTTCSSDSDCSDTQVCSSGSCSGITCSNGYVTNHKCYPYANEFLITDYTETISMLQGESNSTKATIKNNGAYTRNTKLSATTSIEGLTAAVSPGNYNLASGNAGIFTINVSSTVTTEIGYHKLALKAYVSENESIYGQKEITVAVHPTEETKALINKTKDDLEAMFATLTSLFSQIVPASDANYTLANRTYNRLLNMFRDIEENINLEKYLEVNSLLKEANSSLTEFKEQISSATPGGLGFPLPGGDMFTWVAILVVVIVVGGFLVYLLLPPKKGYHPVLGFVPKRKRSFTGKLKDLFSRAGKIKGKKFGSDQKTLASYESSMGGKPMEPEKPPEQEKKTYREGYTKNEKFPMSYKKDEMKQKRKPFGK